jgi:hypothetical protein
MNKYEKPQIIEDCYVDTPTLLAGSVVEKETEVESTGQEVVEHSFTDIHWE